MKTTFKQFLTEQLSDAEDKALATAVNFYQDQDYINSSRELDIFLKRALENEEKYKDYLYDGIAYRILNIPSPYHRTSQPIHDIRQITTLLQKYDQENKHFGFSWTKNKKEALKGYKSAVFNDLLRGSTVTIESHVKGLDLNKISFNPSYKNEQEIYAPKNNPLNIVSFSLVIWRPNHSKQTRVFLASQFDEFKELYNMILEDTKKKAKK